MLQIAEVDVEPRQCQGESQDEEGQEEEKGREEQERDSQASQGEEEGEEDEVGEKQLDQLEEDRGEGQNLPGEVDLLDQPPVVHDRGEGGGEGRGDEGPGKEGREEKEGEVVDLDPDDQLKGDGVDQNHEQGVEEGPEKAQGRPLILQLQVPDEELP